MGNANNFKHSIELYYLNSLCILNDANFNIVYVSVKYKFVEALYCCQCS
jgi:hypothetical protein